MTSFNLGSLTEHAVDAARFADEMTRRFPGTQSAALAQGEATGWRRALILLGGDMPDTEPQPVEMRPF